MNNKPTFHPETPESGQQTNSQAKLDTSEHGTLVPPNPTNGIKNTEMTSNQPKVDNSHHWQNPRICATCTYFYRDFSDLIYPGCPACAMREHTRGEYHRACPRYTPKQTD